MLTGKQLGNAIRVAIKKKWPSFAAAARFFEVQPASVQGWMKTGAISKPHLQGLIRATSGVVSQDHWGGHDEAVPSLKDQKNYRELVQKLYDLAESISDPGLELLLEQAKPIARAYPYVATKKRGKAA